MLKLHSLLAIFAAFALVSGASEWTVKDSENTALPGRKTEVLLDGQLVARLIYGTGQIKPYLNVYDDGDELTHWDPKQTFPHHRGIFIGWNKIASDLGGPPKKGSTEKDPKGTFDLWHFNNGGKMEVLKVDEAKGGPDSATLVLSVAWHAGNKDDGGSDLLLTEKRTFVITRPALHKTQVDAHFELTAARDLHLGGDLQHSGVHIRTSSEVEKKKTETSYVWEPSVPNKGGKAVSKEFKWVQFAFPLGERWYTVEELNAPSNPVEELSLREYGRLGFFFQKDLKKSETLSLQYRFVFQRSSDLKTTPTADQNSALRAAAQAEYEAFTKK